MAEASFRDLGRLVNFTHGNQSELDKLIEASRNAYSHFRSANENIQRMLDGPIRLLVDKDGNEYIKIDNYADSRNQREAGSCGELVVRFLKNNRDFFQKVLNESGQIFYCSGEGDSHFSEEGSIHHWIEIELKSRTFKLDPVYNIFQEPTQKHDGDRTLLNKLERLNYHTHATVQLNGEETLSIGLTSGGEYSVSVSFTKDSNGRISPSLFLTDVDGNFVTDVDDNIKPELNHIFRAACEIAKNARQYS